VACDASSDVLLLGAQIFTGNDVEKATPVAPTASDAQWSLDLAVLGDFNEQSDGRLARKITG
jgi:hypothetical protein